MPCRHPCPPPPTHTSGWESCLAPSQFMLLYVTCYSRCSLGCIPVPFPWHRIQSPSSPAHWLCGTCSPAGFQAGRRQPHPPPLPTPPCQRNAELPTQCGGLWGGYRAGRWERIGTQEEGMAHSSHPEPPRPLQGLTGPPVIQSLSPETGHPLYEDGGPSAHVNVCRVCPPNPAQCAP